VYCEFESPINETEVRKVLSEAPGVILQDEPQFQKYPMPINAIGKNDVFVGRIRRDLNYPNGLHLWIVADNLRKGAAGNAVQIALNLAF
jgi:aspartate-semialdehyde dehydrogenase